MHSGNEGAPVDMLKNSSGQYRRAEAPTRAELISYWPGVNLQ